MIIQQQSNMLFSGFIMGVILVDIDMGFATSSKSLSFARRPGYGQIRTKYIVKANHFFAELPDKDLN